MWILNAEYVRIENSRFMNNKDTRPDHLANDVAFNFGTQNSGGIGLLYHNSSYGEAYIYNCVFINCSASVSPLNINDPRPQPYAGFGHGGALVIRFSNTSNTTVTVGDCVFENSTAYHSGGAVSITMIHHPRNNHVVIRNSSFDNCNARRTGGGLSVQVSLIICHTIQYCVGMSCCDFSSRCLMWRRITWCWWRTVISPLVPPKKAVGHSALLWWKALRPPHNH